MKWSISTIACIILLVGNTSAFIPPSSVQEQPQFSGVQLQANPSSVRVGHLSSDPYPKRKDTIVLSTTTDAAGNVTGSFLEAFTPAGTRLFGPINTTVNPVPGGPVFPPMEQILDVTDLDKDGDDEIIGLNGGAEPAADVRPALYVYNGDGSLQWCTENFTNTTGRLRKAMQLKPQRIKIYDKKDGTQSYIAVIPSAVSHK